MKRLLYTSVLIGLSIMTLGSCKKDEPQETNTKADLVVYGKIYTSESANIVEAFAVKGGKYIYVGDSAGAEPYIERGKTEVINYRGKGLVMPSCGDGHAHYMLAQAIKSIGAMVTSETTPDQFLTNIVPAAVERARAQGQSMIFGFGWNYHTFKDKMPTRQQLDAICSDIPIYFADDEAHKGLVNTLALVNAGIMGADGSVLKRDKDIRGGEIVMGSDGTPTGLLYEQAGTYVRSTLRNDDLYTTSVAYANIGEIQAQLLSKGYTMYVDGWSNYYFNDNFYRAAQQYDNSGEMHFVLGLSHEIESWMAPQEQLAKASNLKRYATKRVKPQWVKLFIDGTVEGGTGYCRIPYPDGHRGIVNWSTEEVADITRQANAKDLSMHIHTMGDSAVALAVDAYVAGGQDNLRNTVVHVRNILPETLIKMRDHNITAAVGMLWHQFHWFGPIYMYLTGMVPAGYEEQSYPMKSFFKYGINMSSSTDYPALSGCPDSPFGIIEVAVTGMSDPTIQNPWWYEELITREEAIQALTINCAKQMFIENERGSITTGKYADFLLVDKDILTCGPNKIHEASVKATYFEGKKVYAK